jgi:hypothetical protein
MARHVHYMLVLKTNPLENRKMSRIEEYTRIEIAFISDCCGEYCRDDAQCCPACGEHCEVIPEEYEVSA